jgi:hypothetical protein
MNTERTSRAGVSVPAIIALIAAIFSFATGAFWGFVLAVVAIIFGVIGVLLALSPNVRGGFISMFSLFAGGIGLIAAVVKALLWLTSRV